MAALEETIRAVLHAHAASIGGGGGGGGGGGVCGGGGGNGGSGKYHGCTPAAVAAFSLVRRHKFGGHCFGFLCSFFVCSFFFCSLLFADKILSHINYRQSTSTQAPSRRTLSHSVQTTTTTMTTMTATTTTTKTPTTTTTTRTVPVLEHQMVSAHVIVKRENPRRRERERAKRMISSPSAVWDTQMSESRRW
jgi:hypothetical protein